MELLKATRLSMVMCTSAAVVLLFLTYLYSSRCWEVYDPQTITTKHSSKLKLLTDEVCPPCQCNDTLITNIIYVRERIIDEKSTFDSNNIITETTASDTAGLTATTDTMKTIFIITPTYARMTQKVDLTSMCHTLMLVPKVVWIIIEDSSKPTNLVTQLIQRCGVRIVHLTIPTSEAYKPVKGAIRNSQPRGVEQRNAGLKWLRENYSPTNCSGVLFFGDDDNKYDLRLFEDIRATEHVSVWKAAWAGRDWWEGPICENGRAISWYTGMDKKPRVFSVDMASFSVHLCHLFQHPEARVGIDIRGKPTRKGYLESDFLEHFANLSSVECRGSETEVYVWHSHTSDPFLDYPNSKSTVET